MFVSLVCLLLSFSKDLSAGKRCFVEVVVNCVSALRALNRGIGSVGHVCEEFHEDFFKLTSMELCAYMLNNFNRSELQLKIKFFNESNSLWGEVVLVTAK